MDGFCIQITDRVIFFIRITSNFGRGHRTVLEHVLYPLSNTCFHRVKSKRLGRRLVAAPTYSLPILTTGWRICIFWNQRSHTHTHTHTLKHTSRVIIVRSLRRERLGRKSFPALVCGPRDCNSGFACVCVRTCARVSPLYDHHRCPHGLLGLPRRSRPRRRRHYPLPFEHAIVVYVYNNKNNTTHGQRSSSRSSSSSTRPRIFTTEPNANGRFNPP